MVGAYPERGLDQRRKAIDRLKAADLLSLDALLAADPAPCPTRSAPRLLQRQDTAIAQFCACSSIGGRADAFFAQHRWACSDPVCSG